MAVDIHQEDRPILSATAWFVNESAGIDHEPPNIPHVPPVALVTPFDQVHQGSGFWFLESSPVYAPSLTQPPPPGAGPWSFNQLEYFVDEHEPALGAWIRLRPRATFEDPALDAGRALVASDWLIPFVAAARYAGRRVVLHSSLDLSINFHGSAPSAEWLYCYARVGVARGGISHGDAQVWADNGTLVATAMQQMVQRVRL